MSLKTCTLMHKGWTTCSLFCSPPLPHPNSLRKGEARCHEVMLGHSTSNSSHSIVFTSAEQAVEGGGRHHTVTPPTLALSQLFLWHCSNHSTNQSSLPSRLGFTRVSLTITATDINWAHLPGARLSSVGRPVTVTSEECTRGSSEEPPHILPTFSGFYQLQKLSSREGGGWSVKEEPWPRFKLCPQSPGS